MQARLNRDRHSRPVRRRIPEPLPEVHSFTSQVARMSIPLTNAQLARKISMMKLYDSHTSCDPSQNPIHGTRDPIHVLDLEALPGGGHQDPRGRYLTTQLKRQAPLFSLLSYEKGRCWDPSREESSPSNSESRYGCAIESGEEDEPMEDGPETCRRGSSVSKSRKVGSFDTSTASRRTSLSSHSCQASARSKAPSTIALSKTTTRDSVVTRSEAESDDARTSNVYEGPGETSYAFLGGAQVW
jgi:hypothetical protein